MAKKRAQDQGGDAVVRAGSHPKRRRARPLGLPASRLPGAAPEKPSEGFIALRARRRKKRKKWQERQDKALEMDCAGHSMGEIRDKLKFSDTTNVRRALESAWRRMTKGYQDDREWAKVELLRMLARNERLMRTWYPRARNGDTDAMRMVETLENRRDKLLRLSGPNRVEVSGPDGGPILIEQVEAIRQAIFRVVETHPELRDELTAALLEADAAVA